MCGLWWIIPLTIYLRYLGMTEEIVKNLMCMIYVILFCLAMMYNDYSNLRRIGRNEDGRKLK